MIGPMHACPGEGCCPTCYAALEAKLADQNQACRYSSDLYEQATARAERAEAEAARLREALRSLLGMYRTATCSHPDDEVRKAAIREADAALATARCFGVRLDGAPPWPPVDPFREAGVCECCFGDVSKQHTCGSKPPADPVRDAVRHCAEGSYETNSGKAIRQAIRTAYAECFTEADRG